MTEIGVSQVQVVRSPYLWHRADMGTMATWFKYTRVVEIGVDQGVFSHTFLSRWVNGRVYLGVDPYVGFGPPDVRHSDFLIASAKYAEFAGVARLLVAQSPDIIATLDGSQCSLYTDPWDLVYVDGDHRYEAVLADCRAWWSKLQPQGLLAGHDFINADCPGVQQAVLEFAAEVGKPVHLTQDEPVSWMIHRGEWFPPDWRRT